MLQNPRLGAPAFEYVNVGLQYSWPAGWQVVFSGKRDGARDYEHELYGRLETLEVVDVVLAQLDCWLGT